LLLLDFKSKFLSFFIVAGLVVLQTTLVVHLINQLLLEFLIVLLFQIHDLLGLFLSFIDLFHRLLFLKLKHPDSVSQKFNVFLYLRPYLLSLVVRNLLTL
jgi:hypothetical protein